MEIKISKNYDLDFVICHYAEIALKGKNRSFFEQTLVENIKKAIGKESFEKVVRISGRVLIKLKSDLSENKREQVKQGLKNVFGVANFSFALGCEQDVNSLKKAAVGLLKNEKFRNFRIETKRSNKSFFLNSQEVNQIIGAEVAQKLKKKVKLENPELTCFIEIIENYAFLYLEKSRGQGGLPVGVSGKALSLLSAGIDSPVASYFALKRGVKVDFIHFYTVRRNKISQAGCQLNKIIEVVKILNKFQFSSRVYLVPFREVQEEIIKKAERKYLCVLCKRFMLRLGEGLAEKLGANALVTGDNIGQVASQTLANIRVISQAIELPVIRPLVCQDKEEIIKKAKEIGTYDFSISRYEMYCQKFLPPHPETKAELEKIISEEKKLNIALITKNALEKVEVIKV